MRAFGINYDTGLTVEGRNTRPSFEEDDVRRDIQAIASDLHATAIRVSGEDPDRLVAAGRYALEAGLELWFSPMTYDQQPDAFADYIVRCAAAAEQLRGRGEVVAVLGCEMSLFCSGFVPGDGLTGRMATMMDPATWTNAETVAELTAGFARAQETQRSIVSSAREVFGGRLTYAAGMWEQVDWELFDIVSVDGYRDAGNTKDFRDQIRRYRELGRPLAITEFGCCTYAGAAQRGGSGWRIVARDGDRARLDGAYQRDEGEQVRYFGDLMKIFDEERCRHGVLVHVRRLRPAAPARRAGARPRSRVVRRSRRLRDGDRDIVGAQAGVPRDRRGLREPSDPG